MFLCWTTKQVSRSLSRKGTTAILRNLGERCQSSLSSSDLEYMAQKIKKVKTDLNKYYPSLSSVRTKLNSDIIRVPQFRAKYDHLESQQKLEDALCVIEGRVTNVRKSSKKLIFIDVSQDSSKIQMVYSFTTLSQHNPELKIEDFESSWQGVHPGDSIAIQGFPFRTKSGELSLRATSTLSTVSVSVLPRRDDLPGKQLNYRVAHYLATPEKLVPLRVRHVVTSFMRRYFDNEGFLEVETPILAPMANGANACPFETQLNADKLLLQLRIAPELYLKKLVVSGLDKVYEIGKVFRNEGIDSVHNPEFTTCEAYRSFTTLNELIDMTEQVFLGCLTDVQNKVQDPKVQSRVSELKRSWLSNESSTSGDLRSSRFSILDFIETIEKQTGELPMDLDNIEELVDFFKKHGLDLPEKVSVPSLLNKVCSDLVEPLCEKPTLIVRHPVQLSPLSKSSLRQYGSRKYLVSHRFELFIAGQEYVNAYEEQNCFLEQEESFRKQLSYKKTTDDPELSMVPDNAFVDALKYGMPPTGGWGCGIDRLVMLLSDETKIDDVLSFGNLKDVVRY